MPGYKCVYQCCSSKTGGKYSLFNFPKNPVRCEGWLKACHREDLLEKNVNNFRLCEKHFEKELINMSRRKRLFQNAFPTIFCRSDHSCDHSDHSNDTNHGAPARKITILSDSVSGTTRSNTRLELPIQGPSRQSAEPSNTFLERPSTSSRSVNKRRRKNIDSNEDDSTSDSSKPIEVPIDDREASGHVQCQSDENMSDSDSLIDIIKNEVDDYIPVDVPESVTSEEVESEMINDDDSVSTHNIEAKSMKEESREQNEFDDRHPVDVFCKSVALSLKSLRRDLCNEGKIRIMQLISELEHRNSSPNEGPSTSKSSNNYAQATSNGTKYIVPKIEFE